MPSPPPAGSIAFHQVSRRHVAMVCHFTIRLAIAAACLGVPRRYITHYVVNEWSIEGNWGSNENQPICSIRLDTRLNTFYYYRLSLRLLLLSGCSCRLRLTFSAWHFHATPFTIFWLGGWSFIRLFSIGLPPRLFHDDAWFILVISGDGVTVFFIATDTLKRPLREFIHASLNAPLPPPPPPATNERMFISPILDAKYSMSRFECQNLRWTRMRRPRHLALLVYIDEVFHYLHLFWLCQVSLLTKGFALAH